MGGNAFAQPGPAGEPALHTPRLTFPQYSVLKRHAADRLAGLFASVTVPREPPGKTSFGDLDFLVSAPTARCPEDWIPHVARCLAAEQTRRQGPTASFAVPWAVAGLSVAAEASRDATPSDQASAVDLPPSRTSVTQGSDAASAQYDEPLFTHHAQIDVHIVPAATYAWELFLHSHGDLPMILARLLVPLNLHVNNLGLHLRLPEIAATVPDRARSLLHLSADPGAVLSFLGIEARTIWGSEDAATDGADRDGAAARGAATETELFDAVTASPLLGAGTFAWALDGGWGKGERRRLATRAMYSRFFEGYALTRRGTWAERTGCTADEVRVRAVRWFGKGEELERMRREWMVEEAEKRWWEDVVWLLPEGMSMGSKKATVRGLKRFVVVKEEGLVVSRDVRSLEGMEPWVVKMGWGTERWEERRGEALEWVKGNWERMKELERRRAKISQCC